MTETSNNPSIFNYLNYRDFLKDLYWELKEQKSHMSFEYLAKLCGFGSTGYLKMIMDGERNLSTQASSKVSRAFGLNKKSSAYFEILVMFNQTKNPTERELYLEQLMSLTNKLSKLKKHDKDLYAYFTLGHHVIIREMVALKNFKEDATWIGEQLSPKLPPKSTQNALDTLIRLDLINRDGSGKLIQTNTTLKPPENLGALDIFTYHNQVLNQAKLALLTHSHQDHDITALTVPIPKKLLPHIKNRVQELRQEIINLIQNSEPDFDEVYQISTQIFPVSRTTQKK